MIRTRLTYSNLMATIAVIIALGGTAYAAATLPKNSVDAKQIAKNAVGSAELDKEAVKTADIGANTIDTSHVKNKSLRAGDIRPKDLEAFKGKEGQPGVSGINGPRGTALHQAIVATPQTYAINGPGNQFFTPFSDASFTQGPQEVDQVYFEGRVTGNLSGSACNGTSLDRVQISVTGTGLESTLPDPSLGVLLMQIRGNEARTQAFALKGVLGGPGQDTPRSVGLAINTVGSCIGTVTVEQLEVTFLRFA